MAKPRRKKLIALLISLAVLVAVVVIADRVAAYIAEDKVAGQIAAKASEQGVSSSKPPDVDITGFPFLTQVVAGEYSQIDITLTDLGSEGVTIPRLDIQAMDVTAALSDVMSGSGPITAASMKADGYISYDSLTEELENLIDAEVTPESGNQLGIKATVTIMGENVEVAGKAGVTLDGDVLSIQAQDFAVTGDVTLPPGGEEALGGLSQQFSQQVAIPEMPYGLQLAEPKFETDNIVVSATAKDVPLA